MAKVVFISAFISPHIKPICDILFDHYGTGFIYVQMQNLTSERRALGYAYTEKEVPYVRNLTDDYIEQKRLIDEADCVIINSGTTSPILVQDRIKSNKVTIFANERLLKRGIIKFFDKRLWMQYRINLLGRQRNLYLLCFGAYVRQDFELIGFPKNRSFKFGYFPEQGKMDPRIPQKHMGISIVWVGRMINWKRPIFALKVMKELKRKGIQYHISMIGDGPFLEASKKYARKYNLNATFYGTLPNMAVREKMHEADLLLSTSNRREGWGAVVNEALSEKTPVVASIEIGCVPYLIKDAETGYSYHTRDYKEAAKCIALISQMDQARIEQSISETLGLWNSNTAGERLCEMIDRILRNEYVMDCYKEGPMSKA